LNGGSGAPGGFHAPKAFLAAPRRLANLSLSWWLGQMTEAVTINNEELAILCDIVSGWGVKK
jgi:hypothetical protein